MIFIFFLYCSFIQSSDDSCKIRDTLETLHVLHQEQRPAIFPLRMGSKGTFFYNNDSPAVKGFPLYHAQNDIQFLVTALKQSSDSSIETPWYWTIYSNNEAINTYKNNYFINMNNIELFDRESSKNKSIYYVDYVESKCRILFIYTNADKQKSFEIFPLYREVKSDEIRWICRNITKFAFSKTQPTWALEEIDDKNIAVGMAGGIDLHQKIIYLSTIQKKQLFRHCINEARLIGLSPDGTKICFIKNDAVQLGNINIVNGNFTILETAIPFIDTNLEFRNTCFDTNYQVITTTSDENGMEKKYCFDFDQKNFSEMSSYGRSNK